MGQHHDAAYPMDSPESFSMIDILLRGIETMLVDTALLIRPPVDVSLMSRLSARRALYR